MGSCSVVCNSHKLNITFTACVSADRRAVSKPLATSFSVKPKRWLIMGKMSICLSSSKLKHNGHCRTESQNELKPRLVALMAADRAVNICMQSEVHNCCICCTTFSCTALHLLFYQIIIMQYKFKSSTKLHACWPAGAV